MLAAGCLLLLLCAWVWREPAELWVLRRGPLEGLQGYVARHPDSTEGAAALAHAYLAAGRPAEAAGTLSPLVERYPTDAALRVLLGRALLEAGDGARAYAHLQVAQHELGANDADTHWWLGQAEERAGRGEPAQAHYREVLRKQPGHVGALLKLARYAEGAGQYTEAREYYRAVLRQEHHFAAAAAGLAEAEYRLGRLPESLAAARIALAASPNDARANLWLARALQATDPGQRGAEAEAAYRRAISAGAEKYTARYYLAQLLREQGKTAEALAELETNVRENPLHAASYYDLALCARILGLPARAASANRTFERLNRLALHSSQLEYRVRVNPDDTALRLKLAQLLVENGRPDLARPHVERVLRTNPRDPEALRLSARIAAHPQPSL